MTNWDDERFRADWQAIMKRHDDAQDDRARKFVMGSFLITISIVSVVYFIIGRLV